MPKGNAKRPDRPGKGKAGIKEREESKVSRSKLWLFRLAAATLVPLLFLAGCELVLRLAGFGHRTRFLLHAQIEGHDFFIPNEKFGFRFFPAEIARTPTPFRMPAIKATNSYRIFLLGESAAQGDPDPSFGVARYVEMLLRERYPGVEFEVFCGAMTAINSHAILPIARELARREGDLWIVYMGNNEMVGPFGAGTVFGSRAPPGWVVRLLLGAKATRTGQALEMAMAKMGSRPALKSWGGMKMFKEHQLAADDPDREQAYRNFEENLGDILKIAQKHQVPVIVSTIASNLKDCAPFASLHRRGLGETEKGAWEQKYEQGKAAESQADYQGALDQYLKAEALDGQFAELRFRIGLCYLALGKPEVARDQFEKARDADSLVFRADDRINEIIKTTTGRFAKSAELLDTARILAEKSEQGVPGNQWFYEHVHYNFDGNYLLGRLFSEQVSKRLPEGIRARGRDEWISQAECENRLAVSDWDRYRVWQINYSRVSEPPFTEQMNDAARARMYMAKLGEIQSGMNAKGLEAARKMYQDAIAQHESDPFLHGNFSQLLDATGDLDHALLEQQRVHELLPQFPGPLHKMGVLLVRQGKSSEAINCLNSAVALRADYVPAINELGLIFGEHQKFAEAKECFARAARLNPGYVETYLNLGFLEQSQSRLTEAMNEYEKAAKFQPDGPAAFFDRGVGLAATHHRPEAVKSFQAAVWMNPNFWQARYLLGVELAADEKVEEAAAQFAAVVKQRPDLAKAHFNLGIALGKQRKMAEALEEFRATVRLNPTNKVALQHVETLQRLVNQRQ